MIKPVSNSNHHIAKSSPTRKPTIGAAEAMQKAHKPEVKAYHPEKDLRQKIAGILEARFGHAFAQEAEFSNMVEAIYSQIQSGASKSPNIAELVKLAAPKKQGN